MVNSSSASILEDSLMTGWPKMILIDTFMYDIDEKYQLLMLEMYDFTTFTMLPVPKSY